MRQLYRVLSPGFDIRSWINQNVNWAEDLDDDFVTHLKSNDLTQYLTW